MHITRNLLLLASLVFAFASPASASGLSEEAMLKQLTALAATGNADAKYNLGMFYNNGIGTRKDKKAAFRYFLEAAQAGNPLAAYKVGCYYDGQFTGIVPLDEQAALKYKLRAAEAGYDLAQHDIAMHYGRKRDLGKALPWLEKASRQGNKESTLYLAYFLSRDDSKDKVKGLALLVLIADRMPDMPKELADGLATLRAQLSLPEKTQAARIAASWFTGRTPLSTAARSGISAVPALLRSVKQ